MIGAFIGGAFVESLGFLGMFESVVALIIYLINWVLIPRKAAEDGNKFKPACSSKCTAVSLFAGTATSSGNTQLYLNSSRPPKHWSFSFPHFCIKLANCLDCLSSVDKGGVSEAENLGNVLWQLC